MDRTPAPRRPWLDRRLVVRHSGIEGRGLFFTEDVVAGTVVIRLGGRLVAPAELESLLRAAAADPAAPYVDTITVYEDAHLVLPPQTAVHFGNHSCDPTLWHVGPYELAARRDVGRGEEATIDYATESGAGGWTMTCRCGTAACRAQVTSDDWRLPQLQAAYRGHWVPALDGRIRSAAEPG